MSTQTTKTTSIDLGQIRQIALTVSDVERAVAFYRDGLGLKLLFRAGVNLAFFDCAGIRLMLSGPEGEFKPGNSSVIYFKVSDIDAAFEALRSRGVGFLDSPHPIAKLPDHELWMTFFRDPDGNTLALMCEKRG
jgi:methylmalonyl-CoA/ethylmalonyl-CoA epimerase